jgi:hypothetical protein
VRKLAVSRSRPSFQSTRPLDVLLQALNNAESVLFVSGEYALQDTYEPVEVGLRLRRRKCGSQVGAVAAFFARGPGILGVKNETATLDILRKISSNGDAVPFMFEVRELVPQTWTRSPTRGHGRGELPSAWLPSALGSGRMARRRRFE